MFKEFPKCLYLGGDVEASHVIVLSADDEVKARAEGFLNAHESEEKAVPPAPVAEPVPEPAKRKPGRPAKAK